MFSLVILFLSITLVLLWQTGVLKPLIQRRGWAGFSQVIPVDWVIAQNNSIYVKVKNEGDVPVRIPIYGVNVSFGIVECTPVPAEEVVINPQDSVVIESSCAIGQSIENNYRIGDYYDADVVVNYVNTVSGSELESVGKLYGHIEEPWSVPPFLTTTSLPVSVCYMFCPDPGSFSIICEEEMQDSACPYCNQDQRCVPSGKCDEYCEADEDCDYLEDEGPNPCKWCNLSVSGPGGKCEEKKEDDTCGLPCWHPRGFPEECEMDIWLNEEEFECEYCWQQYDYRLGRDVYTCEPNGSCGASCDEFDYYEECEERCLYCNTSIQAGFRCEQGDCGKNCSAEDPTIEECELGCRYCDVYPVEVDGDPATYICEKGDCGEYCVDSSTCWEGCEVCYNNRCIYGDLAVTIMAYNDSWGKLAKVDETIFLNVSGTATDGMEKLVVSDGVFFPFSSVIGKPKFDCLDYAAHPSGKSANDFELGEITNPFTDAPDIPWRTDVMICPGDKNCKHIWTTKEYAEGRYCYYAVGRENSTSPGLGRWSRIAADYIDVGYLRVILVYPKPEVV
ncbi:MAG: hypothetical protein ABIH11_01735 [Candidatus Altiarchaeota archaeon]